MCVCRDATVSSVAPFGCIVDYAPGKSGLVHVSELDTARTADPATSWKAGDKIDVMVLEFDKASGRCKLSRFGAHLWLCFINIHIHIYNHYIYTHIHIGMV